MIDLDQLLKRTASDLRGAVRGVATTTSSAVERRVRHRRTALATTVTVLVGLVGVGVLLAVEPAVDVAGRDGGTLITSEEILQDGVVTEAEYRAGAEAVVACLADAGFEVEVNFDNPNGHAGYSSNVADSLQESRREEFNRCIDLYLSENVSLGWSAALGQLDVAEVRQEYTALVECVEAKTGQDFGELTFDEFDYLTPQGQQTRDAAFEYEDHRPWEECQSELGLERPPTTNSLRLSWLRGSAGDALEIVERDGLTLTISGPLDAPCVEVRTEREMAGGCGADLTEPLNVGVGSIGEKTFVSGWVAENAGQVVLTFADGTRMEITEFASAEGLDVLFFLGLVPSSIDVESDLPIVAVALDQDGEEIARSVLKKAGEP